MELRLLGPVAVVIPDQTMDLGGPRNRTVLAMLALNARRVVPVDDLVDAVWDADPPPTARGQIQICVSALRKVLTAAGRPEAIRTSPPGYVLEIETAELDSVRFESLTASARADSEAGRTREAADGLRDALALWHGDALSNVAGEAVRRAAARLDDQRLSAVEERIRLDLALGRHEELTGELGELVARFPLRERLHGLLMLALYRCGRQVEALAVGRQVRATLVEEIGVEPGPELHLLERSILNQDPGLALAPATAVQSALDTEHREAAESVAGAELGDVADPDTHPESPADRGSDRFRPTAPVRHPVPRQLPAGVVDFTGRSAELRAIIGLLGDGAGRRPVGVPIVAISGRGGVGKSALAIRAGHELAASYPDGHLYADLAPPDGESPGKVLTRFLHSLGVSGGVVPEQMSERESLYRTQLAGRRVLIVLDGVSGEDEVRPLLPGSPTCAVVTTSRIRLSGLPGAFLTDIGGFEPAMSVELLGRIVGERRIVAEEKSADELVTFCEGLPLALRIAGARLASRPSWRIGGLVERLRDEARRLDELSHRGLEVRSNIGLTHRALSPSAQRLLQLVALQRTPDFASWATAALLDCDVAEAEAEIDTLVEARLLEVSEHLETGAVRYHMHDLIRSYAQEQLLEHESPSVRHAALDRMFGGWLALSDAAHAADYGGDYTVLHGAAPRWRPQGSDVVEGAPRAGMEWWDSERAALVAAIRHAADTGRHEVCWDLALTSTTLFERRAYFDDWRETTEVAATACRDAGNARGLAAMDYSVGTLHLFQSRTVEAADRLRAALEAFTALGDRHGRALVLRNLAQVDSLRGDSRGMVVKYREALDMMREVGDRGSEAHILRNLARHRLSWDDLAGADDLIDQALAIAMDIGCLRTQAQVRLTRAQLHLAAGESGRAQADLGLVLRIVRGTGDRIGEAHVLRELGVVHEQERRWQAAESTLAHALELARSTGEQAVEVDALLGLARLAEHGGRAVESNGFVRAAHEVAERTASASLRERVAARGDPGRPGAALRDLVPVTADGQAPRQAGEH